MKYSFYVLLIALAAFTVSALPVIEISTADTDGGPTTRFKLLALPILREIAIPDTTLYYMYNHGCSQQAGEATQGTTTTIADNAEVKQPDEVAKKNDVPAVAFYV